MLWSGSRLSKHRIFLVWVTSNSRKKRNSSLKGGCTEKPLVVTESWVLAGELSQGLGWGARIVHCHVGVSGKQLHNCCSPLPLFLSVVISPFPRDTQNTNCVIGSVPQLWQIGIPTLLSQTSSGIRNFCQKVIDLKVKVIGEPLSPCKSLSDPGTSLSLAWVPSASSHTDSCQMQIWVAPHHSEHKPTSFLPLLCPLYLCLLLPCPQASLRDPNTWGIRFVSLVTLSSCVIFLNVPRP